MNNDDAVISLLSNLLVCGDERLSLWCFLIILRKAEMWRSRLLFSRQTAMAAIPSV